MAVAKLKRPKEAQFEELAERIAEGINQRAAKMTPRERAQADSETRRLLAERSVVLLKDRFDLLLE